MSRIPTNGWKPAPLVGGIGCQNLEHTKGLTMINLDSIEGLSADAKAKILEGRTIDAAVKALKAKGIELSVSGLAEGTEGPIVSLAIDGVSLLREVEECSFSTNSNPVSIRWKSRDEIHHECDVWIFGKWVAVGGSRPPVLECKITKQSANEFCWQILSSPKAEWCIPSVTTVVCSGTTETLEQSQKACADILESWVCGE